MFTVEAPVEKRTHLRSLSCSDRLRYGRDGDREGLSRNLTVSVVTTDQLTSPWRTGVCF